MNTRKRNTITFNLIKRLSQTKRAKEETVNIELTFIDLNDRMMKDR